MQLWSRRTQAPDQIHLISRRVIYFLQSKKRRTFIRNVECWLEARWTCIFLIAPSFWFFVAIWELGNVILYLVRNIYSIFLVKRISKSGICSWDQIWRIASTCYHYTFRVKYSILPRHQAQGDTWHRSETIVKVHCCCACSLHPIGFCMLQISYLSLFLDTPCTFDSADTH